MKKIESTKTLKGGSLLRVYKKGYGYARLDILVVHDYFLAALACSEFMKNAREGDLLEAYLWQEGEASYEFPLKVIGSIREGTPILFFSHTDRITRSDERKCIQARVNLPLKFFTFKAGSEKRVNSREIEFLFGTIVELSDREALMEYQGSLEMNAFVRGHIALEGGDMEITGKILHKPGISREGHYFIGFTGMSERERNLILEYVFSAYRE